MISVLNHRKEDICPFIPKTFNFSILSSPTMIFIKCSKRLKIFLILPLMSIYTCNSEVKYFYISI